MKVLAFFFALLICNKVYAQGSCPGLLYQGNPTQAPTTTQAQCPNQYSNSGLSCPCPAGQICMGSYCCQYSGNAGTTTSPNSDALSTDDLDGYVTMSANVNNTYAAEQSPEMDVTPYVQAGIISTSEMVAPAYGVTSKIISGLVSVGTSAVKIFTKHSAEQQAQQEYQKLSNDITSLLTTLNADLARMQQTLVTVVILQDYWNLRQPILDVQEAYNSWACYPSESGVVDAFISECQRYNLLDSVRAIASFIGSGSGSVPMQLAYDFNRDGYNSFLNIVMSDVSNAMNLEMMCLGATQQPEDLMNNDATVMYGQYQTVAESLHTGFLYIMNNFTTGDPNHVNDVQGVATSAINSAYISCPYANLQCVSDQTQAALQSKFNWLQWSEFMGTEIGQGGQIGDYWGDWYIPNNISEYGELWLYANPAGGVQISIWSGNTITNGNWEAQANHYLLYYAPNCCTTSSAHHCHFENYYYCSNGLSAVAKCMISGLNSAVQGAQVVSMYLQSENCDTNTGEYGQLAGAATLGDYCVTTNIDGDTNPDAPYSGYFCFANSQIMYNIEDYSVFNSGNGTKISLIPK